MMEKVKKEAVKIDGKLFEMQMGSKTEIKTLMNEELLTEYAESSHDPTMRDVDTMSVMS